MHRKKRFFQKRPIVERILCFMLAFAVVLTMGTLSQWGSLIAHAEGDSNVLVVHFKNEMNWDTVNAKYGAGTSWAPITGYEDAVMNEYGVEISPDAENEGWYAFEANLPQDITEVNGLFNCGAWGSANQTGNFTVNVSGNTEVWITYTDAAAGNGVKVSDTKPDDSGDPEDPDDPEEPSFTDATIIMHFQNSESWDEVYAYLTEGTSWSPISGYTYAAAWPGAAVEADAQNAGWYSFTITMKRNAFNLIFNNNNKGSQTANICFTPTEETTEKWVDASGNLIEKPADWQPSTSNAPVNPNADSTIQSPVVNADRTVTVKLDAAGSYQDAQEVLLMGTLNGTDWSSGLAMTKDDAEGVWTVTTPVQAPGVYQYKFTVDGEWITDPSNEQTEGGNSKVVVAGLADASIDAERGKGQLLPETLKLYNEEGAATDVTVTYSLEDASLADTVTIADGMVTVAAGTSVETVVLVASYDAYTSKVTVSVKDKVYTYHIYYYDQNAAHMDVNAADLWVWENGGGNIGAVPFDSLETLEDGNQWLKATLKTSALNLGIIPRSGDGWSWQTGNHYFDNAEGKEECEIYIVYGDDANTYTELPTIKELRGRYVIVEYDRPGNDYEGWNIYSWNTGMGSETEIYAEEKNGKHYITVPVADYDVDLLLSFCMRKCSSVGANDWLEKDGGDHYINVPADQTVVKAKFVQGEGITAVLPYNTGYEMDGANDQIHFYYRDDALFGDCTLDTLQGKVRIEINGTTYDMAYDAENERYYYDYSGLVAGDYEYHYVVDKDNLLDAFNPRTTEDGQNSVLTYKAYSGEIEASVINKTMDYNDNNVLRISFTGDEDLAITKEEISSIQADLSALGLGTIDIDPELMEVTIACLYTTEPGEKVIPVTLKDIYGSVYQADAAVTVTQRAKTAGDFDWDEAIIYFAVTDRFFDGNGSNNEGVNKDGSLSYHGGDFAGLNQKLDYLKGLGVNTIWITPIVENSDTTTEKDGAIIESTGYHGYWASDFTKLNSHLGTKEEFSALLEAAHARGMKIMVDVVINHAGYETAEYFNSLLDGVTMIRDADNTVSGSDIYASLSGLPDFVTEDETVRNQLIQWQTDWMDQYDIDYYRVDTVKHVDGTTWSAFKNSVTKANPAFKMTGEYAGAGYANTADELGTGRMDALLDFDFNGFAADYLTGNISSVETQLEKRNSAINNTAAMSSFINSHDEDGLVYLLQKEKGLSAEEAQKLLKVAATLTITAKGQPVIYYGEEIGQAGENNYPYQTNRYDFDWDALADQQADSNSMYNHYKTMLAIRNEYTSVFARGSRQSVMMSDTDKYNVFTRSDGTVTLYVGTNLQSEAQTLQIPVSKKAGSIYKDLYSGATYEVGADGTIAVSIPAAADGGTVVLKYNGETGANPGESGEESSGSNTSSGSGTSSESSGAAAAPAAKADSAASHIVEAAADDSKGAVHSANTGDNAPVAASVFGLLLGLCVIGGLGAIRKKRTGR